MGGLIKFRVEARTVLYPSENEEKVRQSVLNVLPGSITQDGNFVLTTSDDESSLDVIRAAVSSRRTQTGLRRLLTRNTDGLKTWFYLNKQAALAGVVVMCEQADESPLGPICITIISEDMPNIIERLCGNE